MKKLFQILFLIGLLLPNFSQAKIIRIAHFIVYEYETMAGHHIDIDEHCKKVMYKLWHLDVDGKIIGPNYRYFIEPKNSSTTCQHLVTLK